MKLPLVVPAILVLFTACATRPDGGGPLSPSGPGGNGAGEPGKATLTTAAAADPIPQSFTPEAKPRARTTAIRQQWLAKIGKTDHRTTMALVGGNVLVGARGGAGSAIHVIDGKTGAAKPNLPAARGDVIGIAVEKDKIYSTSSGGELAATGVDGKILFRADLGAAATTPPTLVEAGGSLGVAVGDAKGRVSFFDAATGKKRWTSFVGPEKDARPVGAGLAAADTDGDGIAEIYAGSENGWLVGLHATKGDVSWSMNKTSPLRAAPILCDVDSDKKPEVIIGWADGDIGIYDGHGKEKWSAKVEHDNGDPTGLLASPTPIGTPRIGTLLVPTARWGNEDAVVLLRKYYRAYQSQQGRVTSSPVLGVLEPESMLVEAVVGTQKGDVVAFDATGGVNFLYKLDGAIEASAMIADLDGDGLRELVVATADGKLVSLALGASTPPVLSRARGDLRNTGVMAPVDLAWQLK